MDPGAWIHFNCPRCGASSAEPAVGAPRAGRFACPRCRFAGSGFWHDPDPSRPLSSCAICGGQEFYVQKDFNRKLGLAIVVASAAAAFLVMVRFGHLWGLLVLGAVMLVDALVYRILPEVSVCYLCQSVYHGFPRNPEHVGFYQGNEERVKALRQAWLEGLQP